LRRFISRVLDARTYRRADYCANSIKEQTDNIDLFND
jgi:hypothetical protein